MATLLAVKAGTENPFALNDDHHAALVKDPAITAFPVENSFVGFNNGNTTTATAGFTSEPTTFSAPSTGFGATSGGINSPASTGLSGNSGFGTGANSPLQSGSIQVVHNQAESLKSGNGAMSEGGESTVALDKDSTDWVNKKMRPMMGWVYMLTCTCDFIVFPILWSLLQALSKGQVTSQWQPLTLQGAGLYHIAMGAVLGIAAYGRTKEKVAGVA